MPRNIAYFRVSTLEQDNSENKTDILSLAIEIISYGGPDPSIRKDDLNNGIIRALSLNGSKPAVYDTDGDERLFFVVIITVHEVFLLEDSNQDKLKSNQDKQESNIDKPKSNIDKQGRLLENLYKVLLLNYRKEYRKQILKRMIYTLMYCDIARTKMELLEHIGLKNRQKTSKNI